MARTTKYDTEPGSEGVKLLRAVTDPLKVIANRVGALSSGTISDYRRNRKTPNAEMREAFQLEYGISPAAWDDPPSGLTVESADQDALAPTKTEVESQILATKAALADPVTAGSPATRARYTSEMRALLKLRSQIESQVLIDEDRIAASEPYQKLVQRIVAELASFPEARDKVIGVLS